MKTNILISLILLMVVILSSGCGKTTLPEIGTIKVGFILSLGFAPLFVGVEKGYFEEQGLQVALQSFTSGSTMISLLSTGGLDVGAGETGSALFNAIHEYTGMPETTIEKSVTYYFDPDALINRDSVKRIQQYLVSKGYTEYSELIPISNIIDLQYLEAALERVGEFEY